MGSDILKQAVELVKTNPKAAYSLVLGTDAALLAKGGDAKTAYEVVAAQHELPMGSWGGAEYAWPEPEDFEVVPEKRDVLGDYIKVTYQYDGDLDLFVGMNASAHADSQGKKPGRFEARYYGNMINGPWRTIEDIPRLLDSMIGEATKARQDIEAALTKVGGPQWEVIYDWGQLSAEFKNPVEASDTTMNVTFEDIAKTIFGDQNEGEATISFAAGSDYQGFYGQQSVRKTYRSVEDIEKILKEAEHLWAGWNKPT
jgi:hypothetical protein